MLGHLENAIFVQKLYFQIPDLLVSNKFISNCYFLRNMCRNYVDYVFSKNGNIFYNEKNKAFRS